jgi:hypothetical protein
MYVCVSCMFTKSYDIISSVGQISSQKAVILSAVCVCQVSSQTAMILSGVCMCVCVCARARARQISSQRAMILSAVLDKYPHKEP